LPLLLRPHPLLRPVSRRAIVGYDHGGVDGFPMNSLIFGLCAGDDFAVSNSISLGVEAEASDSTADEGRREHRP
jgi:hypothetical protein